MAIEKCVWPVDNRLEGEDRGFAILDDPIYDSRTFTGVSPTDDVAVLDTAGLPQVGDFYFRLRHKGDEEWFRATVKDAATITVAERNVTAGGTFDFGTEFNDYIIVGEEKKDGSGGYYLTGRIPNITTGLANTSDINGGWDITNAVEPEAMYVYGDSDNPYYEQVNVDAGYQSSVTTWVIRFCGAVVHMPTSGWAFSTTTIRSGKAKNSADLKVYGWKSVGQYGIYISGTNTANKYNRVDFEDFAVLGHREAIYIYYSYDHMFNGILASNNQVSRNDQGGTHYWDNVTSICPADAVHFSSSSYQYVSFSRCYDCDFVGGMICDPAMLSISGEANFFRVNFDTDMTNAPSSFEPFVEGTDCTTEVAHPNKATGSASIDLSATISGDGVDNGLFGDSFTTIVNKRNHRRGSENPIVFREEDYKVQGANIFSGSTKINISGELVEGTGITPPSFQDVYSTLPLGAINEEKYFVVVDPVNAGSVEYIRARIHSLTQIEVLERDARYGTGTGTVHTIGELVIVVDPNTWQVVGPFMIDWVGGNIGVYFDYDTLTPALHNTATEATVRFPVTWLKENHDIVVLQDISPTISYEYGTADNTNAIADLDNGNYRPQYQYRIATLDPITGVLWEPFLDTGVEPPWATYQSVAVRQDCNAVQVQFVIRSDGAS
jgi:hypothetical protein